MQHLGTKVIETERLILRPFVLRDATAMYHNWASDEIVTKYLTWPTHADISVSEEIIKEWIAQYGRDDFYQWAIVYKANADEPIGSIGINNRINEKVKMAHVGYCIGRPWWHMGITSEALKCVMKYLFDEVGVNRIESRHDPRNANSGAVMKKCGMKYEGTWRQSDWNNQGLCDAAYYALLASER